MEENFSKDPKKRNMLSSIAVIILVLLTGSILVPAMVPKNSKSEVSTKTTAIPELAVYRQCFDELIFQSWGFNLLYCKELENPVVRTVVAKNWNLLEEAGILNFTSSNNEWITFSPCNEGVTNFCHLLSEDLPTEEPTGVWVPIPPSNGVYTFRWADVEKRLIIKYQVNDQTFYGVINKVQK